MNPSKKDNLTDIAQSLPSTPPPSNDANAGTVVSSNGTRITLGQQGTRTQTFSSTTKGTNPRTK